ncbi:hypothetical protein OKN36_00330 [Furfurilactobacillus sp. OKN36]
MLEIINFNIADDDLHNLKDNRVFKRNSPADRPAEVKFLEKPSNDQTQENLLSRLVDYLYQTTGVVNIDDQDFTNAASGKSLDHKLLTMTNKADAKAAKFTESLMRLYGALLRFNGFDELVTNLRIKFIKTVPHSLTDEATALVSLVPVIEAGLLSKETALSLFSFIEDPAAELVKVHNEKQEQARMVMGPTGDDNLSDGRKLTE